MDGFVKGPEVGDVRRERGGRAEGVVRVVEFVVFVFEGGEGEGYEGLGGRVDGVAAAVDVEDCWGVLNLGGGEETEVLYVRVFRVGEHVEVEPLEDARVELDDGAVDVLEDLGVGVTEDSAHYLLVCADE